MIICTPPPVTYLTVQDLLPLVQHNASGLPHCSMHPGPVTPDVVYFFFKFCCSSSCLKVGSQRGQETGTFCLMICTGRSAASDATPHRVVCPLPALQSARISTLDRSGLPFGPHEKLLGALAIFLRTAALFSCRPVSLDAILRGETRSCLGQ